jgi:thiaminase
MDRPDIEKYKENLKHCCERHNYTKWCESYGCSDVKELIDYILLLEKLLKEFEEDIE